MHLLDANSHNVPEGDYLRMCNALKEIHETLGREKTRVRSMNYYEYEDEMATVTQELTRLRRERDAVHYRTKMTAHMKTDAIREYAFREGLHSLREFTPEALELAAVRVNPDHVFAAYLEAFNTDVYEKKKAMQTMIQEARDYRDDIVRQMAGEL